MIIYIKKILTLKISVIVHLFMLFLYFTIVMIKQIYLIILVINDAYILLNYFNYSQEPVITRKGSTFVDSLPPLFLDPSLDAKKRSRLIEKEMNEQAKIINDLRYVLEFLKTGNLILNHENIILTYLWDIVFIKFISTFYLKTINIYFCRLLGASQSTIEQEVRRLHELETAVFNDFRRDVIKKLRRQSVKVNIYRLIIYVYVCIHNVMGNL